MLPTWMTVVEGKKNTFSIDPDIFYPQFLKELEVEDEDIDRYWLEVAYGCMKNDAIRAAHLMGARSCTLLVRGDDGRKMRWNYTMHKPGKEDISADNATAERNSAVKKHYRRIRGA